MFKKKKLSTHLHRSYPNPKVVRRDTLSQLTRGACGMGGWAMLRCTCGVRGGGQLKNAGS